MQSRSLAILVSIALSSFAQGSDLRSVSYCEDARLELRPHDIAFSAGCGKNPHWQYVVEGTGSSYLDFTFGEGIIARKKVGKYPGQDDVECTITMHPKYPLGCTFSPSYVGFRGTANINRNHNGAATITLTDADDPLKTIKASSPPLRGNLGEFAMGFELDTERRALWAPCTGEATLTYRLRLTIANLDPNRPGQFLSFIRQRKGAIEIHPSGGLGFRPCVPAHE